MPKSSTSASTDNDPENRTYEKPVAWLAGRDLLGGIKGILLYTAYGSKLDPRDWMSGQVFNFKESFADKDEFWFDFLADAGDGTKAMYAIAYLTMSDLWKGQDKTVVFDKDGAEQSLPRGEFLLFGGDTAYHVADYLTLANRIQRPFTYAFRDLRKHHEVARRPIFGIPGNHDYYDQVDGFRRQFRKPVRPEPPQPPDSPGGDNAQLGIAGYYRAQEASYFALKLPFGWWVWGLDTETGPLDNRQKDFFAALGNEDEAGGFIKDETGKVIPPDKLIIATSSPTTVFGKVADEESDFKATQAIIELLGPEQPFLPTKRPNGTYDFSQTGDARMQEGQCRLDISGDVHHYARYWGPHPNNVRPAREHAKANAPSANSYASIVSGSGGAFHHPSNTYDDNLQEQVLYPDEETSRKAVGNEVFNFLSIWTGGYVWLFGLIIALVIYFGVSVTQSSRQDLSNIGPLPWVHLNIIEREQIMPTTARLKENPCAPVREWRLKEIKLADEWTPTPCSVDQPVYFFLFTGVAWPRDLTIGTFLILLSLGVTITTFFLRDWLFGPKDDPKKRARAKRKTPNPSRKVGWIVTPVASAIFLGMYIVERYREHITPFVSSLMVLFTIIVATAGIALTVRYNDYLFQKGHDDYVTKWDRFWPWVLPILSVMVLAAGLTTFGRNNLPALLITDILFSLVIVVVLVALTYFLPFQASGELFYGRSKVGSVVGKLLIGFWHALLQLAVPFVLVRRGTWITWILIFILVIVPSLLEANFLQKRRWVASITKPILRILPTRIAAALFGDNRRVFLAISWFLFGALVLVLPWLTSRPSTFLPSWVPSSPFLNWLAVTGTLPAILEWFGARTIFPSLVAGLVGAVMSCLWFGWYLGVCSVFNGHNNEIGGAARIENFKQFIRFKVTKDRLTGYVIAVDDVSLIGEQDDDGNYCDGRVLKPKLIDVFHLEPRK